jgi:maltooligosyltrehalose trehalohydrolase
VKGLPGWHFLGYLQNHDQVGNRAKGERIGHLTNVGRVKIGAALVFCSPFIPMLFQGEEFGASAPFPYFTSHQDPNLGRLVREGRRREFEAQGWDPEEICDPQDPETFARAKLDWSEPVREPHAMLLEWHRKLIALRKATPALCDGRLDRVKVQYDEGEQWLVLRRGAIAVSANLCSIRRMVPAPSKDFRVLLSSAEVPPVPDGSGFLDMQPDSVTIVESL